MFNSELNIEFCHISWTIVNQLGEKIYNSSLIKQGQSQDKRLSILIDKESIAPILYHPDFTEEFSI